MKQLVDIKLMLPKNVDLNTFLSFVEHMSFHADKKGFNYMLPTNTVICNLNLKKIASKEGNVLEVTFTENPCPE
jgi:hypothetical protein